MKRTGGLITACACILACLLFTAGLFLAGVFPRPDTSEHQKDENTASLKKFNVLLLGSDARPGEKVGNTDTIMVAHVSPERIAILSIPRDTRVEIPGKGTQKINSAARYGGPELTAAVVSDLIGVDVDKYVLVRWEGFIKIVDILGGVTVDVPKDMYYDSGDGEEYIIDLKKGKQRLNGRQALAFARFRNEALGDIDRSGQQLALMKSLIEQAKKPATLLKLPWLVPQLYKNVETNLDLQELLILARAGSNLNGVAVVTQTLPGYFLDLDGVSYWGVEPEQARQVAYNLFTYGITTTNVVLEPPYEERQQIPVDKTPAPPVVAQNPEEEKEEEPPAEAIDLPDLQEEPGDKGESPPETETPPDPETEPGDGSETPPEEETPPPAGEHGTNTAPKG